MKTILKSVALSIFIFAATVSVNAQTIVRKKPVAPQAVAIRPPAPSPKHAWVSDEWKRDPKGYVWEGGHWETPPSDKAFYVKGHWRHVPKGYVWAPGHWR